MKQMKTESSPCFIEWKGFYHKIAQKIFRLESAILKWISTKVSYGMRIDDEKDVHQLSKEMESLNFRKWKNHYPRLI